MFSHVTLGTQDLERAGKFYDGLLGPIGLQRQDSEPDGGPDAACWGHPGTSLSVFYAHIPFDGKPATVGNGCMVAFSAPSPEAVDAAYQAGLNAGGRDEGPPGPRPHYGEGYYGAYLRDPDGNKVHVVFRGDVSD
ncbi:VOC family protein [Fodinicurvata halophila]|uniref:VOC family protein n=1 Tax=Fodinicurvata halophila TaxID=1419723 RepID=A0ABV8UKL3_9PROT